MKTQPLDRFAQIQDFVDQWVERARCPSSVPIESVIGMDDGANPWRRLPGSQLAWWSLLVSTEHLDASLRLLSTQLPDGHLLPAANYTTLRTSALGACTAIYVLLPTDRDERVVHAFQVAWEEYRQVANLRRDIRDHPGLLPEVKSGLPNDYVEKMENARIELGALIKERGGVPRVTDTELQEAAVKLAFQASDGLELMAYAGTWNWRLNSSSAHGRLLMSAQRPSATVISQPGGGRVFTPQTSLDELTQVFTMTWHLLHVGWQAWDRLTAP